MEDKLRHIFSLVNEWLKFAEAKNAALIAFSGAGIWGVLQLLKDANRLTDYKAVLICILITLMACLIVSLSSFVARKINKDTQKQKIENSVELNLLFFGHINKLDSQDYLKALYKKYGKKEEFSSCSSYEKDLANQIVINAEIAMTKCTRFNQSITILFCGLIVSTIGLIIIA